MHLHKSMVKGQMSPATVYTHCMTSSRACPNERGLPPSWSRWRWCERCETESRRRLNSSSTVLSLSRCTISPGREGEGREKGRKGGATSRRVDSFLLLTCGEVEWTATFDLGHLEAELLLQDCQWITSCGGVVGKLSQYHRADIYTQPNIRH